jgi:hypothetical protein
MGNWHVLTATHFIFPVGHYDKTTLANAAHNYLTYTQELSATWTPSPSWMFDLSSNISFNERNDETNYKSGDIVGLTWGANYRLPSNPNWQVGLHGLYLDQIEDDELPHGVKVPDGGFRIEKFNAGTQLTYWFNPSAAIMLKWTREWEVENAPQGDLFWLQAAFPI